MDDTLRRAICFTQSINSNANLPETPSQAHSEMMFTYLDILYPLTQSSGHIRQTTATMIKMFQSAIMNTLETDEKINSLSKYSLSREIDLKDEPNGHFRSENIITKITKSSVNGPNRRVEVTEERVNCKNELI